MILQTAAEAYLVSHFEDAGLCAIHGKVSHSDAERYTSVPSNQERQGCQKRHGVIGTADRGQGVKDLVDRPEAYIWT